MLMSIHSNRLAYCVDGRFDGRDLDDLNGLGQREGSKLTWKRRPRGESPDVADETGKWLRMLYTKRKKQ